MIAVLLRPFIVAWIILGCLAVLPAQAAEALRIYRMDGSRQCEEGSGRSLARDAQALRRLGIRIHSMAKRNHPTMLVIMMCGAQSARANTYVIAVRDWRRYKKRLKGFDNWPK
jgi:hypothetical protein